MRDQRLVDLNFREILHYGGQPSVKHNRCGSPWPCNGYCVSCEESRLLGQIGGCLDLISHGCDSEDFTTILGPMPPSEDGHGAIEHPALFLLEDPGGDYRLFAPFCFRGLRKRHPAKHYYWSPNGQTWPTQIADFDGNFYGPYFALLMRRHQLRNVYITNVMKCKWIRDTNNQTGSGDKSLLVRHCADLYLQREVRIFEPRIVFCFGRPAESYAKKRLLDSGASARRIRYLRHPSAIKLAQRYGKSPEEMVAENDQWIRETLAQIV